MNRNLFHVFYVAMSVFLAVLVTALCGHSLHAMPREHVIVTAPARETRFVVVPKFILLPMKDHVCNDLPAKN